MRKQSPVLAPLCMEKAMGSIDVFLMFAHSETTLVQAMIVIYKNCHLTPLCAHGEKRRLKNGLAGLSKNTKANH